LTGLQHVRLVSVSRGEGGIGARRHVPRNATVVLGAKERSVALGHSLSDAVGQAQGAVPQPRVADHHSGTAPVSTGPCTSPLPGQPPKRLRHQGRGVSALASPGPAPRCPDAPTPSGTGSPLLLLRQRRLHRLWGIKGHPRSDQEGGPQLLAQTQLVVEGALGMAGAHREQGHSGVCGFGSLHEAPGGRGQPAR
jgi:hypothetical protein